jgi:hypothetical protein
MIVGETIGPTLDSQGFLSIGLFLVFSAASLDYLGYVGLFQRLFLAVPFLWIEAIAARLFRISGHDPFLFGSEFCDQSDRSI